MNFRKHLDNFITKFIDWIFRVKQLPSVLFNSGIGFIILAVGAGFKAQFENQSANGINKFLYESSSTDLWLQISVLIIGFGLVITGAYLWIKTKQDENNSDKKKRLIVIEQRGLRNTSDNSLSEFVAKDFKGQVKDITTDIRERIIDGKVTAPDIALDKVKNITTSLQESCNNISSENLSIIHGGLLPVPYTFLTGLLLDDENNIVSYDWDREQESWRKIEGDDDNNRFKCNLPDSLNNAKEVVLSVSISYKTDMDNIKLSFPNMPIIEMEMENISTQSHWSNDKQSALAIQFLDFVKKLDINGVKKINLVIAGQNSLVFRFGRIYDKRNLPEAVIWQYERTETPAFNWGIELPIGSIKQPTVVNNPTQVTIPKSA